MSRIKGLTGKKVTVKIGHGGAGWSWSARVGSKRVGGRVGYATWWSAKRGAKRATGVTVPTPKAASR